MKKLVSFILVFVLILSTASFAYAAETTEYIVVKGDTLSEIAAKHNTTVSDIMALNPKITSPDKIKVGDKLIVPVGTATEPVDDGYVHYTVKAGDTLSGIAAKHNTTVSALLALNPKISNADSIREGQDIIICKVGEEPASPPEAVDDGYVHYTVKAGDTLSEIAVKFNTTVSALLALNPKIKDENAIREGQDIIVGTTGTTPVGPDNPGTPDVPDVPDTPAEPTIPELTVTSHTFFEDSLSVNFKNTDIGDVLNVLAQISGKNIIYTGDSKNVTVKASGTFKDVVTAVCTAHGSLTALISGNSCFIGPEKQLKDTTVAYKDVTKVVALKNIAAADLTKILGYLTLPECKCTPLENDKMAISITATPYNMAAVLSVIGTIDRADNIVNGSFSWKKISLTNLGAADFAEYARYFGYGRNVICDNSVNAVFVCGAEADITLLAALAKAVDIPSGIAAYRYTANGADAAIEKVAQTSKTYAAKALTIGEKTYLIGTAADINTYYSALEYYRTAK